MIDPLELAKYLVVAFGLAGFIGEVYITWRLRKKGYAWLFWSMGVVLLFWAAYYIDSLFFTHVNMHQTWVRSGILLTIGLIDAGILNTIRRLR